MPEPPAPTAVVPLPRRRPPQGARLLRLRVRDRPGSLARVAERLAAHGVDILRIEVLERDGGYAIDDLLVAGDGLADALHDLRGEAAVLVSRDNVDLPDPALAMAAACTEVARARSPRDAERRLLAASLRLVFADAGFVCVRNPGGWLWPAASTVAGLPVADAPSLLHSALASGAPLGTDARAPWAPPAFRAALPEGTVLVVPGRDAEGPVLGLVRRGVTPFAEPEPERLQALLDVARGVLATHDTLQRTRRPPRWESVV